MQDTFFPFFLFRFIYFIFLFRLLSFLFSFFFFVLFSYYAYTNDIYDTCLCPATLRNLRDMDRTSDFYNTCYAIIYKSILNAYIDVCICDELGYILMYIYLIIPIS